MAKWLESVDFALWPYTLHYAMQSYYTAPVLEDSFLGTQAGKSMKAQCIFESSVFTLQNSITTGNIALCWSQHMRSGLKLIPNSISLGRNYQVTIHTTTDILPK